MKGSVWNEEGNGKEEREGFRNNTVIKEERTRAVRENLHGQKIKSRMVADEEEKKGGE